MAYDDEDELSDGGLALAVRPNVATPQPAPPDVAPPAAAPPMPVAPAVSPVKPTAMQSGAARIAQLGPRPDPNAPQYAPVKPSMGASILNRLAAGAVAFGSHNPAEGVNVRRQFEQTPITTAANKFNTAQTDYNQRFGEAEQENAAEEKNELDASTEAKNEAEANKANRPTPEKFENVNQGYAAAITDALSRGVDPASDPHVMAWKQAVENLQKQPEAETPLGDAATNLNKTLQDRYQVLHPGKSLPSEYSVTPQSTQKDYDRIEKALGGAEGAEGTKAQRDLAASNHAAAENDKKSAANDKKVKPYQDTIDSIDEATEFADHPSATNDYALLMNFIGNTKPENMGKIRLNPQEIKLSAGTRGALGDLDALVKRVENGEMLTVPQRKSMLDTLAVIRRASQRNIDRIQGGGATQPKSGSSQTGGIVIDRDANGRIIGVH